MDTDTEIGLRARFVEMLRKLQSEVRDIDALTYAAHRLADGIVLSGDEAELAEAQDSVESAAILARVAQQRARDLFNDIEEEIGHVDVMSDDDDDGGNDDGGEGNEAAPPPRAKASPLPEADRSPLSPTLM